MSGMAGTAAPGRIVARLLLAAGAIQFSREQPFILAAGWASPVYVDCRCLLGEPRSRQAVTELLAAGAGTAGFDAIAGAETAGIPWATALADRAGLPLRYVRKRALGVGRNAQVEGGPVQGLRVLLVDDLTTDAASKVAFVRGLRAAGATVTDALSIFHHGAFPGGSERLARLELRLHALATWRDVLALEEPDGLDPAARNLLEAFLADPLAWSAAHGGRATPLKPPL